MKAAAIEVRIRREGRSFRLQFGIATTKAQLLALQAEREALVRMALRGEWDVLDAVKAKRIRLAEIVRLVDQYGVQDYRFHLRLSAGRTRQETLRERALETECERLRGTPKEHHEQG